MLRALGILGTRINMGSPKGVQEKQGLSLGCVGTTVITAGSQDTVYCISMTGL